MRKDRVQADFLINALAGDRPGDLAEACGEVRQSGRKWRERIAASLARLSAAAVRLAAFSG